MEEMQVSKMMVAQQLEGESLLIQFDGSKLSFLENAVHGSLVFFGGEVEDKLLGLQACSFRPVPTLETWCSLLLEFCCGPKFCKCAVSFFLMTTKHHLDLSIAHATQAMCSSSIPSTNDSCRVSFALDHSQTPQQTR